jgi:hypothetical protein
LQAGGRGFESHHLHHQHPRSAAPTSAATREVIRRRPAELGLSQADLAKAAGVDTRQIRRYEASQQQPVLWTSMAKTEADARELVGELKEQDAPSSR